MDHDRRLIEDSLPLEAISFQSAREKSIQHGHISTLHLWWARRPLAAMRAAIFASLIPAPETEEERAELHKLIGGEFNPQTGKWEGGIADWDEVKNGNSAIIERAKALIAEHYPDAPPKLLDPFMGGGSVGLVGHQLNCDVHGLDINPVAHLIELGTLVFPQKYGSKLISSFRTWGQWVYDIVKKDTRRLFPASELGDFQGYLWARTIVCPNCALQYPLVNNWWLSKRKDSNTALRPIIYGDALHFEIVSNDQSEFDANSGTITRGMAHCLKCGNVLHSDFLHEEADAGRMESVPLASVYRNQNDGRYNFDAVTEQDFTLFSEAKDLLKGHLTASPDALPTEPIPKSQEFRVTEYGIHQWGHIFNARQALVLMSFVEAIHQAEAEIQEVTHNAEFSKAIVTYLAFALDQLANQNSTLSTWNASIERVNSTYVRQAISMTWSYFESNPFSEKNSSWIESIERISAVLNNLVALDGDPANISYGSAMRLPYDHEETRFDLVATDPPYYDSIQYGILSDFFYVWLKRSVGHLYPEVFSTPLTNREEEIVPRGSANEDDNGTVESYLQALKASFKEVERTLAINGLFLLITPNFSNDQKRKTTKAGLVPSTESAVGPFRNYFQALLDAGMMPTSVWPLYTEMNRITGKKQRELSPSTLLIVCRRPIRTETEGDFLRVRAQIRGHVHRLYDQDIPSSELFWRSIGPAFQVFGQYQQLAKPDDTEFAGTDVVDIIAQEIAELAIVRDLENERSGN